MIEKHFFDTRICQISANKAPKRIRMLTFELCRKRAKSLERDALFSYMKNKAESSITKTPSRAAGRIQTHPTQSRNPLPTPKNPSDPNRYNRSINNRGITIWNSGYRVLTARWNGSNQRRRNSLQCRRCYPPLGAAAAGEEDEHEMG